MSPKRSGSCFCSRRLSRLELFLGVLSETWHKIEVKPRLVGSTGLGLGQAGGS